MTGGTDWAVVVPTIAGAIGIGGIAGAIITTYGGHGRVRREARSKVLASLEEIEITRRTLPLAEGTYYDLAAFAKLGTECMIAGVPRSVVTAYDQICNASRRFTLSVTSGGGGTAEFDAVMASLWLSDEAARLMGDALWRPRLMFLLRWWRVKRLRRKAMVLYGDFWQGRLTRTTYRNWLKAERGNRRAQRAAVRAAKGALPGAARTATQADPSS
jgi:hypothetical protein